MRTYSEPYIRNFLQVVVNNCSKLYDILGRHFYCFPLSNASKFAESVTSNTKFNSLKEFDSNLTFDYDILSHCMYFKAPICQTGVDVIRPTLEFSTTDIDNIRLVLVNNVYFDLSSLHQVSINKNTKIDNVETVKIIKVDQITSDRKNGQPSGLSKTKFYAVGITINDSIYSEDVKLEKSIVDADIASVKYKNLIYLYDLNLCIFNTNTYCITLKNYKTEITLDYVMKLEAEFLSTHAIPSMKIMVLDEVNYVTIKKVRESDEIISLDTLLKKFFTDFIERATSINSSSKVIGYGSYYCASEFCKKMNSPSNNFPSDTILFEAFYGWRFEEVLSFIRTDYGIPVSLEEDDIIFDQIKRKQIHFLVIKVISYIQNTYAEFIN